MKIELLDGIEGIVTKAGNFYPIPKGGSDTGLIDLQGESTEDDEDGFDDDDDDDIFGDDDDDDDEESLAAGFLENVDEADRPIVEKYLRDWDAGVTKRFQELHSTYEPYREFGEPEEIAQAMEIVEFMRENPQDLYEMLKEEFGGDEQGLPQEPGTSQGNESLQGLPPEFMEEFGTFKQVVELLASNYLESQEQSEAAQQDEELDNLISSLKEEHGDFDEEYVLTKMLNGADPEKAVRSYRKHEQRIIQRALQERGMDLPPVLGGGGPSSGDEELQRLGDVPKKDIRDFVAGLLDQTSRNNI